MMQKEEELSHCTLMSFHTLTEHLPYAKHRPYCVGNQSWVKCVPWPPWDTHYLVGETDVDINNYNILQKNTIATGKIQIKCCGSQRREWFIPQKEIGKSFIKEMLLKDGQSEALLGSMRKGTPDWGNSMGKCMESWKEWWSREQNKIKWDVGC